MPTKKIQASDLKKEDVIITTKPSFAGKWILKVVSDPKVVGDNIEFIGSQMKTKDELDTINQNEPFSMNLGKEVDLIIFYPFPPNV